MIELRWLETKTNIKDGECFAELMTVRTLQYRNASEMVSQDRSTGAEIWTVGTSWQDVPVVHADSD